MKWKNIEHTLLNVEGRGNPIDWAIKLFDQKYKNFIYDAYLSFSNLSKLSVAFYINEKVVFITNQKGLNAFCETMQDVAWGKRQCAQNQEKRLKETLKSKKDVIIKRCDAGMCNMATSFYVYGLGTIGILCGCKWSGSKRISENMLSKMTIDRKNGLIREEEYRKISQIKVRAGDAVGDITKEQVKMFKQLALMVRDLLTNTISSHIQIESTLHEIGICLASISDSSEYLMDQSYYQEWYKSEKKLGSVLRNIRTISEQINIGTALQWNLLTYYYSKRGDVLPSTPYKTRVDIVNMLEDVINIWEGVADRKGIGIKTKVELVTQIYGDPMSIRQLLHNLISNAIKYSYTTTEKSKKRFIEVLCMMHDPGFREKRINIKIINYGVGILPDEINKLGELGFRGELAITEQPFGFGIGVYVAKQIAENHSGRIRYKSTHLHDTDKIINNRKVIVSTYLTECSITLPV